MEALTPSPSLHSASKLGIQDHYATTDNEPPTQQSSRESLGGPLDEGPSGAPSVIWGSAMPSPSPSLQDVGGDVMFTPASSFYGKDAGRQRDMGSSPIQSHPAAALAAEATPNRTPKPPAAAVAAAGSSPTPYKTALRELDRDVATQDDTEDDGPVMARRSKPEEEQLAQAAAAAIAASTATLFESGDGNDSARSDLAKGGNAGTAAGADANGDELPPGGQQHADEDQDSVLLRSGSMAGLQLLEMATDAEPPAGPATMAAAEATAVASPGAGAAAAAGPPSPLSRGAPVYTSSEITPYDNGELPPAPPAVSLLQPSKDGTFSKLERTPFGTGSSSVGSSPAAAAAQVAQQQLGKRYKSDAAVVLERARTSPDASAASALRQTSLTLSADTPAYVPRTVQQLSPVQPPPSTATAPGRRQGEVQSPSPSPSKLHRRQQLVIPATTPPPSQALQPGRSAANGGGGSGGASPSSPQPEDSGALNSSPSGGTGGSVISHPCDVDSDGGSSVEQPRTSQRQAKPPRARGTVIGTPYFTPQRPGQDGSSGMEQDGDATATRQARPAVSFGERYALQLTPPGAYLTPLPVERGNGAQVSPVGLHSSRELFASPPPQPGDTTAAAGRSMGIGSGSRLALDALLSGLPAVGNAITTGGVSARRDAEPDDGMEEVPAGRKHSIRAHPVAVPHVLRAEPPPADLVETEGSPGGGGAIESPAALLPRPLAAARRTVSAPLPPRSPSATAALAAAESSAESLDIVHYGSPPLLRPMSSCSDVSRDTPNMALPFWRAVSPATAALHAEAAQALSAFDDNVSAASKATHATSAVTSGLEAEMCDMMSSVKQLARQSLQPRVSSPSNGKDRATGASPAAPPPPEVSINNLQGAFEAAAAEHQRPSPRPNHQQLPSPRLPPRHPGDATADLRAARQPSALTVDEVDVMSHGHLASPLTMTTPGPSPDPSPLPSRGPSPFDNFAWGTENPLYADNGADTAPSGSAVVSPAGPQPTPVTYGRMDDVVSSVNSWLTAGRPAQMREPPLLPHDTGRSYSDTLDVGEATPLALQLHRQQQEHGAVRQPDTLAPPPTDTPAKQLRRWVENLQADVRWYKRRLAGASEQGRALKQQLDQTRENEQELSNKLAASVAQLQELQQRSSDRDVALTAEKISALVELLREQGAEATAAEAARELQHVRSTLTAQLAAAHSKHQETEQRCADLDVQVIDVRRLKHQQVKRVTRLSAVLEQMHSRGELPAWVQQQQHLLLGGEAGGAEEDDDEEDPGLVQKRAWSSARRHCLGRSRTYPNAELESSPAAATAGRPAGVEVEAGDVDTPVLLSGGNNSPQGSFIMTPMYSAQVAEAEDLFQTPLETMFAAAESLQTAATGSSSAPPHRYHSEPLSLAESSSSTGQSTPQVKLQRQQLHNRRRSRGQEDTEREVVVTRTAEFVATTINNQKLMRKELQKCQNDNFRLIQQLSELQQKQKELQASIADKSTQLEQMSQAEFQARDEISRLRADRDATAAMVVKESRRLHAQLDATAARAAEDRHQAEAHVAALQRELSLAQESARDGLAQLTEILEQRDGLCAMLECQSDARSIVAAVEALQALRSRVWALEAQLRDAQRDLKTVTAERSSLTAQVAALTTQVATLEEHRGVAEGRLAAAVAAAREQGEAHAGQLAALKGELSDVQSAAAAARDAADVDLRSLRCELDECKSAADDAADAVRRQGEELSQLSSQAGATVAALTASRDALQAELAAKQSRLDTAVARVAQLTADVDALQAANASQTGRIRHLGAELDRRSCELESLQSRSRELDAAYVSQLAAQEQRLAQQHGEELQRAASEREQLSRQLVEGTAAHRATSEQLRDVLIKLLEAQSKADELGRMGRVTSAEAASLHEQRKSLEQKVQELRRENEQLQRDRATAATQLTAAAADAAGMRAEVQRLTADLARVRTSLEVHQEELGRERLRRYGLPYVSVPKEPVVPNYGSGTPPGEQASPWRPRPQNPAEVERAAAVERARERGRRALRFL